jgi:hypothetical protein
MKENRTKELGSSVIFKEVLVKKESMLKLCFTQKITFF